LTRVSEEKRGRGKKKTGWPHHSNGLSLTSLSCPSPLEGEGKGEKKRGGKREEEETSCEALHYDFNTREKGSVYLSCRVYEHPVGRGGGRGGKRRKCVI